MTNIINMLRFLTFVRNDILPIMTQSLRRNDDFLQVHQSLYKATQDIQRLVKRSFIEDLHCQNPGIFQTVTQPAYEGRQQTGRQEGQAAVVMSVLNSMKMEHPCPRQIAVKIIFRRMPAQKEMADIKAYAQVIVTDNVFYNSVRIIECLDTQIM